MHLVPTQPLTQPVCHIIRPCQGNGAFIDLTDPNGTCVLCEEGLVYDTGLPLSFPCEECKYGVFPG